MALLNAVWSLRSSYGVNEFTFLLIRILLHLGPPTGTCNWGLCRGLGSTGPSPLTMLPMIAMICSKMFCEEEKFRNIMRKQANLILVNLVMRNKKQDLLPVRHWALNCNHILVLLVKLVLGVYAPVGHEGQVRSYTTHSRNQKQLRLRNKEIYLVTFSCNAQVCHLQACFLIR